MKRYPIVVLNQGKEAALKRFHPWLFSGAIQRTIGTCLPGDVVEIFSFNREYIATGHYQGGSIAVKLFSFQQREIDYEFWKEKIGAAYRLRTTLGLTNSDYTNAYRLVFTEGDGLPGLIIDWYNGVAVIQTHSPGMHMIKPMLTDILKEIYGERLKAVYDKSSETMLSAPTPNPSPSRGRGEGEGAVGEQRPAPSAQLQAPSAIKNDYLFGSSQGGLISETGHPFNVDWEKGQKTGFFLDQRSNRMFAQFYAKDRKVLNAFCYSGAFSVYALKGGATRVHSVDSSKQAIEWTEENITLNGFGREFHQPFVADVKKFLVQPGEMYDMIILDPPAFAKHHNITHNALQAYIHINASAMNRLNPGSIMMTFSCSQAISREMFRSAVQTAALESGRTIRILHHLSQGPDHPVSIYHPEGEYLKGLILEVS
ncbi:MAG: class I SAM-dependent rRNA methyltransferase [Bacteroidetes bacterium]|nr:class I SAM-dependent rRNA methyltransferase [Bacteroidota bacterium]